MATAEPAAAAAPAPVADNSPFDDSPQTRPWRSALVAPAFIAIAWAVGARVVGASGFFASVAGGLLLLLFVVAIYTDLRWRRIYNWTTYTAVLWAILLQVVSAVVPADASVSFAGHSTSFAGFLGCPPLRAMVAGFVVGFVVLLALFIVLNGG